MNNKQERGFTDSFAQEFMVPQIKFWQINIYSQVKPGKGLMVEYYKNMLSSIMALKKRCSAPYMPSGLYKVVLTIDEVEMFKGIIGDNYRYLQERIQEKKDLGVSFMEPKKEKEDLAMLDHWITVFAPNLADSKFKKFWAPFEKKTLRPATDGIDESLNEIGTHLHRMREGMWSALKSGAPDSGRQATHSARELIDQTLKEGCPEEFGITRKERAKYLIKKYRQVRISEKDVQIIDASCELLEAEHNKMVKLAHERSDVDLSEAKESVEAAERILNLLFSRK